MRIEALILNGDQPLDEGWIDTVEVRLEPPAPFLSRKGMEPFAVAVGDQRREIAGAIERRR